MHHLWPAESMLAVQRANTGRVARRITPAIGRRGAKSWSVNGKPTTLLDTEVQDSLVDSGPSATPNRPDLRHIDSKWQQGWVEHEWKIRDRARRVPRLDALSAPRIPFYPYHEASMRTQVICDVLVRFKRMQGFYVLHPMGWDAFKIPEDFSPVHPCWPNQSDPEEEKRVSVLRMITALCALNGSSGRQRRRGNPFSIDPATTKECAFKAETVVIDPEYLTSNVLQKNSKTDDLSVPLPVYNYHGLVGADVVRVSLLVQELVGENNESNTRHFDSIRFWFGQIQTLVHDMYAQHSRWKYRLLHSTPRTESAQRSTWIKDKLLQSRIDPTLYWESSARSDL